MTKSVFSVDKILLKEFIIEGLCQLIEGNSCKQKYKMSLIPRFHPTFPQLNPTKKNVVGKAREFIEDLNESMNYPKVYSSLGTMPEKTFILSSEPGLGKTLSINTLNNSRNRKIFQKLEESPLFEDMEGVFHIEEGIRSKDLDLLLFEYDIGRYGTAYINMGSRIIQGFFDTCFEYSSLGKKILISIDECDALFNSRKSNLQGHSEDRKVLETLMKNLQVAHDTPNVYVVMMTNFVEAMDEASIRAGRVDRRITLELPNLGERKIAFENAIYTINGDAKYKVIRDYDSDILAECSNGFSYADIYQSVENGLKKKAKEMIKNKEPGIIRAGYVKQGKLEQAIFDHRNEFKKKKGNRIGFV